MQSNDDVGKVAAASTHMVACAVEEFLDELVKGAVAVSLQHGNGKMLSPSHLKAHVAQEATLDFCKDIVASAPDVADDEAKRGSKKPKTRRRDDTKPDKASNKKTKKRKAPASDTDDDEDEFGLIAECLDDNEHVKEEEEDEEDALGDAEDEDYDDI